MLVIIVKHCEKGPFINYASYCHYLWPLLTSTHKVLYILASPRNNIKYYQSR